MIINIVTRHSADCPHSGDEQYKRCNCWKHLRFYKDGKLVWKSTKERTWAGAERFKRKYEDAHDPNKPKPTAQVNISLRDATKAFLDEKKGQNLHAQVVGQHKLELNRLCNYMENIGVYLVGHVTLPHLSGYKGTWPEIYPSSLTRHMVQGRLREFFEYATDAYDLPRNPAKKLKPITTSDRPPTKPFTPEEYASILATINTMFYPRLRQQVYALTELMRYSGLAIQDAVCLPRTALQSDATGYRIVTSRVKTKISVSVPVPAHLATLLEPIRNGHADYFFWNGRCKPESAGGARSLLFRKVFDKAGMPDAHSHMLRDTFAVEWLKAGLSLFEVSKLLGHSNSKTTEKYYAPWVKGLQDKMESSMRAHWEATTALTQPEATS